MKRRVRLPPRVPHGRDLRSGRHRDAGRHDGARIADSAGPAAGREVPQLRERRRSGGHGLDPEPDPLLRLRPAVRDVRRRGGVHLPVGHPARGLRRLRGHRDGHLHRAPRPRPALRLAQGSPPWV